jgi:hypothetical protein
VVNKQWPQPVLTPSRGKAHIFQTTDEGQLSSLMIEFALPAGR